MLIWSSIHTLTIIRERFLHAWAIPTNKQTITFSLTISQESKGNTFQIPFGHHAITTLFLSRCNLTKTSQRQASKLEQCWFYIFVKESLFQICIQFVKSEVIWIACWYNKKKDDRSLKKSNTAHTVWRQIIGKCPSFAFSASLIQVTHKLSSCEMRSPCHLSCETANR